MTAPGEYNPLEGNRYDGIVEYAEVVGLLAPQVTDVQRGFIVGIQSTQREMLRSDESARTSAMTAGEVACDLINAQVKLVLNHNQEVSDPEFSAAAKELYKLYREKGRGFNFGHQQAIGCVALRFIDADPDAQLFQKLTMFKQIFAQANQEDRK